MVVFKVDLVERLSLFLRGRWRKAFFSVFSEVRDFFFFFRSFDGGFLLEDDEVLLECSPPPLSTSHPPPGPDTLKD